MNNSTNGGKRWRDRLREWRNPALGILVEVLLVVAFSLAALLVMALIRIVAA